MDPVVSTTAPAAPAATETTQAPAAEQNSSTNAFENGGSMDAWDEIVSELKSLNAQDDSQGDPSIAPDAPAPTQAKAEPEKPAKKKLPPSQARIESARERIIAERTKAPIQDHAQKLHSELQQERQYREQYFSKQKELLEAGDYDGLLQMATGLSLKDVQQRVLEKRGALPPPDPRLDAMQQKLQSYEQAEQQRQRQLQERQLKQQQQAKYKQNLELVKQNLKNSEYEGFDLKAEAQGYAEHVLEVLSKNPHLPDEDVYRQVDAIYEPLAESLVKAFYPDAWAYLQSKNQPHQPGQQAGVSRRLNPGAAPAVPTLDQAERNRSPEPTVLRQGDSADAGSRRYQTDHDEWLALKSELRQLERAS